MRQYINLVTSTLRGFYRIIARFNPLIVTGSRHRVSRARAGQRSVVACHVGLTLLSRRLHLQTATAMLALD